MTVRTRFAPSPTGFLHLGGARTALYAWAYARHHHGQFVLRIEDTDIERSTQPAIDAILEGMEWLGLDYDEGPIYQTKRFERYHQVIQQLLDEGQAYYCSCSKARLDQLREQQMSVGENPRYDGKCRHLNLQCNVQGESYVVRFKNPQEGQVSFDDLVLGSIVFDNAQLDDFIIQRSDGAPTYNFTVVVDDVDMSITHVIRGNDHVNNTPKQLNIMGALKVSPPKYAHLPMILGDDGTKLSKRHGALSVTAYRDEGFLPEAMLNYLVRLGWSHQDQEIFVKQEIVQLFDLAHVSKSAAAFNSSKLHWVNQQHIQQCTADRLLDMMPSSVLLKDNQLAIIDLYKSRCETLLELENACALFSQDEIKYDEEACAKFIDEKTNELYACLLLQLDSLQVWEADHIKQMVKQMLKQFAVKFPQVAQPLRIALTGSANAPSIDQLIAALPKTLVTQRLVRFQKNVLDSKQVSP